MTYYELLLSRVELAQKQHPRSVVMLNADTFEVELSARNVASLRKKAGNSHRPSGTASVIVGKPGTHQLTLLHGM